MSDASQDSASWWYGNKIEFKLRSGRNVWVRNFGYSGTYDGLMEGLANAKLNRRIIDAQVRAELHFPSDRPPLVIGPETREGPRGSVWMPPICCRAQLESSPFDQARCGSALKVIWFSTWSFFGMSLDEFIPATLSHIDWDAHAHDYDI